MKLTRTQQVYLGILGLGLLALLLDKTMLGPSDASGDVGPTTMAPAPADASTVAATSGYQVVPSSSSLGKRLDRLSAERGFDPYSIRDAFLPSPAWISDFESRTSTNSPMTLADEYLASHRLIGLMTGQDQAMVVILRTMKGEDDATVYMVVNDELDGFTLVSVDAREAVLKNGKVEIVLELKEK